MRRHAATKQAAEILRRLEPLYSGMTTGLRHSSPLELLVATVLSAQCTDERVNMVTPVLFSRYGSPAEYASAEREELERIIHSCGFYRNKAKSIQALAEKLDDQYDGQVPATMKELVTLPGVARKTANVVLAHAFGRNEGIAVDTHVQRLSRRLGLSAAKEPEKIEAALMTLTPQEQWGRLSDLLIWHGRRVCVARKPRCGECVLADICPSVGTG